MNTRRFLPLAAAAALALSACGGAATDSNADSADSAPTTASGGSASNSRATVNVVNIAYKPDTMKVLRGTEVTWKSADQGVVHTVTSGVPGERAIAGVTEGAPANPDGRFDGQLPDAGSTFAFTFEESGTFAYFCEVHPSMTAEIVVE